MYHRLQFTTKAAICSKRHRGYRSNFKPYSICSNFTYHTPQMCRIFLDTYVGALFIRNGLPEVQNFVSKLIDPNATPEDTEMMTDFSLNSKPAPPPPSQPPPPPPPPPDYSAPPGAYNNGISLAVFNQVATQRGYAITWPAESTGPPHLPTWTVRCCCEY